ncbi:MAG: hypothetical protein Q8J78_09350 [Moraxellaceae bacterium]|nr:hypothetical protein [Moraxellaceae bacterium]
MDKQQGILAAVGGVIVLAAAAFWWSTQGTEEPSPAAAPVKVAPMAATVSTPLGNGVGAATAAPSPETDAIALSEEPIDQFQKENEELASRAADLEEQVKDGSLLLALKEKQLRELEAELKALEAANKSAKAKAP